MAAASQIFYSTGIGWGTLPAFASYNRHDHNFVRDAWLVPVINCGTSFLAGLAAFSVPRTHVPPSPSTLSAVHRPGRLLRARRHVARHWPPLTREVQILNMKR